MFTLLIVFGFWTKIKETQLHIISEGNWGKFHNI